MKRKIFNNLILGLLCVVFALPTFSGCAKEKRDETKTWLNIYSYNGGIGIKWLEQAAERFEELYADYSFEEGKLGIDIDVANGKANTDAISAMPQDIFFVEQLSYNDMIAQELLLDISDVITSPLNEVRGCDEEGTILDKLYDEHKKALPALDGKYYLLPHYECYSGCAYDVDLFDKRSLFIREGTGETQFTNLKGKLSVGPDGIRGTYDDGLPSSYEEFFALLDRMLLRDVEPFIYSGKFATYINNIVTGLWTGYVGKDQFMLNVEYDSTITGKEVKTDIVMGFDQNGQPNIENKSITPATGYLMKQQAGRYYALSFLAEIMKDSRYFSSKISSAMSHLDTQTEYVYSSLQGKPIAMIIEGSYWYNEARSALEASAKAYPGKGDNRNFAWMPLPRQLEGQVSEGNGTKNTLLDTLSAYAMINAKVKNNPVKEEVSKLFLKFLYTDAELINFTEETSVFKGVKYNTDESLFANMSKYAQSIYKMRSSSDVVYPISDNKIFITAQSEYSFFGTSDFLKSTVNNQVYSHPFSAYKSGISPQDYFKGMWTTEQTWTNRFSQYFN